MPSDLKIIPASKHGGSCSVGHIESAIFHCNMAMQQGHVENCGGLHPYFTKNRQNFGKSISVLEIKPLKITKNVALDDFQWGVASNNNNMTDK